ncbi:hypothetical protein QWY31_10135 [Cytophagales bacterium LB-30]|uniref:ApeA N-terminal domain-containing protein n=1 Tax=Shiella aurantiaca TaxID=3058365 RepID=A0ABT8F6I3_9BACT|nr:HEPN domain-containing protein [Shiella aurantiaca]MDN4165864.1 hypothetical protein [Shiella aurantiaca]
MVRQYEIKGEWFLPNDSNNRVHGNLKYHPNNGADLELYGSLESDQFFPQLIDQDIILGISSESELVTLVGCAMTHSGGAKLVQGQESGKPTTIYSVIFTLVGIHAEKKEDLLFDTISSEIFNLGEWVGISGFKYPKLTHEEIKACKITIEYLLPEPIKFKIDKSTNGTFNFISNRPGMSRYQKKIEINQRVEFTAKTEKDKTIEQLLEYLFGFQNFLILVLYKSTYPQGITLKGDRFQVEYPDGKKYRANAKLYFSVFNYQENEKPKLDFDLLFEYRSIKDDFERFIQNWFSKYELLEPAFDLLIEQFHRRNQFNVNTFLNLAQAAETFHARTNNHTKIPRDEYKKMKKEVLESTPSKYHPWLKEQFNFGNNLNLHRRLSEILGRYSNDILDVIISDKEEFVKRVKHSRNYYTHYSKDGKKKALKGSELFYLSEKLKLQLVCAFLMEIGFTKDQLSKSLDKVKWRLFNHLVDWKSEER